jgi:hypothetical protein
MSRGCPCPTPALGVDVHRHQPVLNDVQPGLTPHPGRRSELDGVSVKQLS